MVQVWQRIKHWKRCYLILVYFDAIVPHALHYMWAFGSLRPISFHIFILSHLPTGTELHWVVVEVHLWIRKAMFCSQEADVTNFGGGNAALKYAKMQLCHTGISKNDVRITLVNVNVALAEQVTWLRCTNPTFCAFLYFILIVIIV